MTFRRHRQLFPSSGFTLVELVIVIVVLGVLSVVFITNDTSPAELTLPSQAQTLASNIRYTQALAYTTGNRMRLTITRGANGTYTRSCATGSCASVTVALEKGVELDGPDALEFNTLGVPSTAATYTLTLPSVSSEKRISVAAVTGFVTVAP